MATVNISLPVDGDTIDAADYNTPITTIVNELNGNLSNANIATNAAVDGSKIADTSIGASKFIASVNPETRSSELTFDYVASGCVWSGDSYGSTRAASMTAGVIYITGKRITVSAVSARSFTASKDTYVDVDNTGTLTYTEVTNSAASPSLAANNIRLAIIVTGASSIAAAGSVNQGQEGRLLPIASSVPYAVTDSLGNLICPRDPQRRVLGYRIATTLQTATTIAQATGLSCPVIVPANRKVKVTGFCGKVYSTTSVGENVLSLWDGTVSSGTQIAAGESTPNAVSQPTNVIAEAIVTPTSSSKTYNVGYSASAGSGKFDAAATFPAFIKVELV